MCESRDDLGLHLHAFAVRDPNDVSSSPVSKPLLNRSTVDSLDVTILVDNSIDALLPSGLGVVRPPGTDELIPTTDYAAPYDYDSTRDHLWNFFQSVKSRKPSIEGPEFGNACAIACHMANYSYFNHSTAVWDADARCIKS
jgi:hypothetical protein